jgi:hypothetical protein
MLKQWVLIPHGWGSRKAFIYGHLNTKDPRLEALLECSNEEGMSYVATPEKSSTSTNVTPSSLPSIDQLGSKDYEILALQNVSVS